MSVLVLLIPPRPRQGAGGAATAGDSTGEEGIAYVYSPDGLQIGTQGRSPAALLPRADSVVAVLADSDVSWQRITLPKAPAARLRAALGGMLEDQLLDEDENLHLAIAPGATPGQAAWVAAMDKGWLRSELERVQRADVAVDRVVSSSWPGDAPQGHFFDASGGAADAHRLELAFSDEHGASLLRVQGSLARALLPASSIAAGRFTAAPAVAAAAEHWLGARIAVLTEPERALRAARSPWNLLQFDLAPSRRGARALRGLWRRLLSPAWRPVRIGLAGLVVVQLVGVNVWAWKQRQAIAERRQAQEALVRSAFPGVRTILDAPLQMERETDQLRAAAGRPGVNDLEAMLAAAASAWPDGQPPAQQLRFEPGRLTLAAPGWGEPQVQQFRERLRTAGWSVESADGRVTLSRRPATGAAS